MHRDGDRDMQTSTSLVSQWAVGYARTMAGLPMDAQQLRWKMDQVEVVVTRGRMEQAMAVA